MTDKKFTDDEIIKALECCSTDEQPCSMCPLWQICGDGRMTSTHLALAIINRQNAELEDLREIVFMDRSEAIKNLKAEAIKEFAENVKAIFECVLYFDDDVKECILNEIDELVKEMTEGNHESQST